MPKDGCNNAMPPWRINKPRVKFVSDHQRALEFSGKGKNSAEGIIQGFADSKLPSRTENHSCTVLSLQTPRQGRRN